ncbi:MAG: hypothetical protein IPP90_11445 [Gemmatimonadaceae bacterium]|nr:hypothetical protein [Gemmatimonadaceae bacterium]
MSSSSAPLCAGGSIDVTGDGDGYDSNPTQPSSRASGIARGVMRGITDSTYPARWGDPQQLQRRGGRQLSSASDRCV